MEYLQSYSKVTSLDGLNSVYTSQIKAKNTKITSATTTFLYFWNKTSKHSQYEYYLYKKSSYPSKFISVPYVSKKIRTSTTFTKPTISPSEVSRVPPAVSLARPAVPTLASSLISSSKKKDENWNQNWDWETKSLQSSTDISTTSTIKITIPRTQSSSSLLSLFNVSTVKKRKQADNPYASKKPIQSYHYPYSVGW